MNTFRHRILKGDFKSEVIENINCVYRINDKVARQLSKTKLLNHIKERLLAVFDNKKILHIYSVENVTTELVGINGGLQTLKLSGDIIETETEAYLTAMAEQEEEAERQRLKRG